MVPSDVVYSATMAMMPSEDYSFRDDGDGA